MLRHIVVMQGNLLRRLLGAVAVPDIYGLESDLETLRAAGEALDIDALVGAPATRGSD